MNFSTNKEKSNTHKTSIETHVDFLFIVTENLSLYLIPTTDIYNKSTLNLCNKYISYKVN